MLGWILWTLAGGLLILALLSPLESLRWWSRDGHQISSLLSEMTTQELIDAAQKAGRAAGDSPQQYVVYLSGVGAIGGSAESNSKTERRFLSAIQSRLDRASVTGDVFPYSVQNLGLPQRRGGSIWERASRGGGRKKGISLLPWIINLRNVFQVLVASDPRYGPTYGLGLAQVIWKSVRESGYVLGSGATVTILGYSGGAQMALNAAWFLEGIGIPMQIVSMGGVFENHASFARIRRFIHLYGEKDSLMFIGRTFSPGRWKRSVHSEYNLAKAEGRVVETCIGPMSHDAKKWYLDHKTFAADGRSYFDTTVDAVVEFLEETPLPTAIPR